MVGEMVVEMLVEALVEALGEMVVEMLGGLHPMPHQIFNASCGGEISWKPDARTPSYCSSRSRPKH